MMNHVTAVQKALVGIGAGTLMILIPFGALAASNSVDCTSIDGNTSAAQWYSVGRDAANEGYLNTAYSAMNHSIQDASATPSTTAAALTCLAQIDANSPILDLPNYASTVSTAALKMKPGSAERRALETFAFRALVQQITNRNSSADLPVYASLFSQPGAYRSSAQALLAVAGSAKNPGDAKVAATIRTALAEIENGSAPAEAKELRPFLQLSLARNLYAAGANAPAIVEYEKLFKIGQPMQDALIESAWAQLRSKNYMKSIGLGYELSTGKLSEFFAPEALSIRAISFVENCRYSDAKKTVAKFNAEYAPLQTWLKNASSNGSLYEASIARFEGAVGGETIPERAWSIYSESPLFVADQNAIQKSFREQREVKEWIVDHVKNAGMKAALLSDTAKIPAARARAANRIEAKLADLNRSMLVRISAEAERLRFVSIEANQGAGRDLVYRNANPGIADVEKDMAKSERKAKSYKGKLAWGKAKKDDPSAEMWTDEIGAYEGQTLNRCGAKAKYQELRSASL